MESPQKQYEQGTEKEAIIKGLLALIPPVQPPDPQPLTTWQNSVPPQPSLPDYFRSLY